MYNKTTANEIRVYQEIAEAKDPISEFTSDFHGTRSEDGKHHKAFPLIASKNLVFFRSDDSHRLWAIAFFNPYEVTCSEFAVSLLTPF